MAGRQGLRIDVPKAGEDKPRFGRVAIITAVGFIVGIAWPRIAGVKLAPSVPSEIESAAAPAGSDEPALAASDVPPPAEKVAPAGSGEPTEVPAAPEASDRIKVADGKVVSCRDAKGGKKSECDAILVDDLARPKIFALAECPAAKNVQGTLSLGIDLDFESGKVGDFQRGKSTNLPDATADALVACAKKEFSTFAFKDVKHEHAKYTVFYVAEFLPPGEKAAAPGASAGVTEASGHATVAWEVAIIRDKPKDGEIIARLMRGTRVTVTGHEGDWYRIKYDAKGSEGWAFRTAIGM